MNNISSIEKFCLKWEERALLSYCVKNIDYFYSVISTIDVADFIDPEHQTILMILKELHQKEIKKFDMSLVIHEAENLGVLNSAGGANFIKSLYNFDLSRENFSNLLVAVAEASSKHKLFKVIDAHRDKLLNKKELHSLNSVDLVSKLELDILDISTKRDSISEPVDIYDGLEELIDSLKDVKVDMSGLSTGFPILDRLIDGLVSETLTVIAARKKMGKSTLLLNISLHVAYNLKKPVLYVDTEMSTKEVRYRCLSILSGIPERDIIHGGYTKEQSIALKKAVQLMSKGLFFHEKMPGYSVEKITTLYKKFKLKHDIGLGVFDYLKEPDLSSVDRNRKEYQILGDVTTKLKDLAGILEIPFLTAVQLNRDHDVADSDKIARYADVVAHWTIRNEEERELTGPKGGMYKLIIKDSRRGGTTDERGISFHFMKKTLTIKEVEPRYQTYNFLEDEKSDEHNS